MSLPHRGLKLRPYGKALLQGLSIDPKSKAPDKHSQLKIFSLSYRYIYIKNWYRTPKIVPSRFSLLQCTWQNLTPAEGYTRSGIPGYPFWRVTPPIM